MDRPPAYDEIYERFDSPLMQRIRSEAYAEDIGQHSWVTAHQLRCDARRLELSASTRLLDLGCGPCGPLTYLVQHTHCRGIGVDVSIPALVAGRARADRMRLGALIALGAADDARLPFRDRAMDVVVLFDVMLHLSDREQALKELARVLAPGGR